MCSGHFEQISAVCSTGSSLLSYQPDNRSIAVWSLGCVRDRVYVGERVSCLCVCVRAMKPERYRPTTRSCPRGSGHPCARDGWDAWRDGRMNDSERRGRFAFVIRALTSVNLIKSVCMCVRGRVCVFLCQSPFWPPAGTMLPLSMVCPSSDSPRLTN